MDYIVKDIKNDIKNESSSKAYYLETSQRDFGIQVLSDMHKYSSLSSNNFIEMEKGLDDLVNNVIVSNLIGNIIGIDIYEVNDNTGTYIFYTSGMAVDADGSPNAYHPNNIGLDYLANAGYPGNWWALATDSNGNPYIQNSSDPSPGYYVSTTAAVNSGYSDNDPRRYVNSETEPYIVIPRQLTSYGVGLYDNAIVTNTSTNKQSDAIVADIGPKNKIGEGSIKLADNLGINSNPKGGGTSNICIEYRIYKK